MKFSEKTKNDMRENAVKSCLCVTPWRWNTIMRNKAKLDGKLISLYFTQQYLRIVKQTGNENKENHQLAVVLMQQQILRTVIERNV